MSIEKRSSSFAEHLQIVESGNVKTASARNSRSASRESLLDKLARELSVTKTAGLDTGEPVAGEGAPALEGQVISADSSVSGVNPGVLAATEAVIYPQTAIAGGNPGEAAAGEISKTVKPNEGVAISAGDGNITDANNLHRTPTAVAAAARDGGGIEDEIVALANPGSDTANAGQEMVPPQEKTAAEANAIGQMIARSFQAELEKIAKEDQYNDALEILKEAGLLDAYNLNDDGLRKTAFFAAGGLDKIASNQSLTRNDIISAAIEYVELEKQACDVEEQARNDARLYAAQMIKRAEDDEATKGRVNEDQIDDLMEDPEVMAAVKVLKEKNLL